MGKTCYTSSAYNKFLCFAAITFMSFVPDKSFQYGYRRCGAQVKGNAGYNTGNDRGDKYRAGA